MQDELRAVLYRALVLTFPPWLRHQQHGRYELRAGVAFTASDMDGPSFNKVMVLGASPSLERILELAAGFYAGKAGGYGVLVEAGAGHPVETELKARGWRVEEDEPALVMPTLPAPSPSPYPLPHRTGGEGTVRGAGPADLLIRSVADESLQDMWATATAGFGTPPEMAKKMAPSLGYALDPAIALLVGYAGSQPVATAACFCSHGVAWIAGVSTVPEARRSGYGTALTWAALAEGSRRGCSAAALNTGPMSYALYRRMGFEHVCNHHTYAVPS